MVPAFCLMQGLIWRYSSKLPEHPSVKNPVHKLKELGWEVLYWPVDNKGVVKIDLIDEIFC